MNTDNVTWKSYPHTLLIAVETGKSFFWRAIWKNISIAIKARISFDP